MSILGDPEKPARRNALPAQSPENKKTREKLPEPIFSKEINFMV